MGLFMYEDYDPFLSFSFCAAFSPLYKEKKRQRKTSPPLLFNAYFPNSAMPSLIRCSAVSRHLKASSELWAPSAFST